MAAVTIVAGLVSGLLPAMHWTGRAPVASLAAGTRATGDRRSTRLRGSLVAGQVAMAAMLLAAGGLLMRSQAALAAVDTGFRGDRVLTMEYRLPANKYTTPARQAAVHDAIVRQIAAVPGVRRAALVRGLPLSGNGDFLQYVTADAPANPEPKQAAFNTVTDEYFRVLGIPTIAGRTFDDRDTAASPLVVVVSRDFARRAWPDRDPIGQILTFPDSPQRPEVIGVVGDVRQFALAEDLLPAIYARNVQTPGLFMTVAAEIDGDADPLAARDAVRAAVWRVDPDQPVWKIRTLASLVDAGLRSGRSIIVALAVFGAAALLLVTAGVYGVTSQSVAQRAREIGIRMVLGADRRLVLGEVLRSGLSLAAAGLAIGVAGALVLSRFLGSMLYDTSALDVRPYAVAIALIALVALAACYLPARRAASVEPARAIRDA
jgi:predicted permease